MFGHCAGDCHVNQNLWVEMLYNLKVFEVKSFGSLFSSHDAG